MIKKRRASGARRARAIVILPSAFTLGTLFFGFWSIVSTIRGDFTLAAWLILLAGVGDTLDGRVARFARTGSRFGSELDSLVDVCCFGLAPAVLIYTLFLQTGDWSWTLAYLYVSAVAMRLARFNIEQGGEAKHHFLGLPSPAAGMTLAMFYPFSQTPFFAEYLSALPWTKIIPGGMIVLAVLMMSHMIYPAIPRLSLRTHSGRVGIAIVSTAIALLLWDAALVAFPAWIAYILFGAGKTFVLGLQDRLPERGPVDDELQAEETERRDVEYEDMTPHWSSQRDYEDAEADREEGV